MPYKVYIIKTDGSVEQSTSKKAPEYEVWKKAVAGFVQEVPHFSEYAGLKRGTAYCNEEGQLLDLPFNTKATTAWLENLGEGPFSYVPRLFGDVIFFAKVKEDAK